MAFSCFSVFLLVAICVVGNDSSKSYHSKSRKDILRRLANVHSIEEFEKAFNVKLNGDGSQLKKRSNLFGSLMVQLPYARGQPRACEPQPTVYTIPHEPLTERHIPDCLNVTRCGGCCSSSLTNAQMECVANETQSRTVKVVYIDKTTGGWKPKLVSYVDHTSCKCQCKIQAENCTAQQTYDPLRCSCYCNVNASLVNCPPLMEWSYNLCGCRCKSQLNSSCRSSHAWNTKTCTCDCIPRACAQGHEFESKLCQCVNSPTTSKQVVSDATK